jgi:sensor histidine kinase YesM
MHLVAFAIQTGMFIGLWELIQVINNKLERFYSFEEKPVTRIVLQVLVSILFFLPVFFITFYFVRPYLPTYVDSRFMALIYLLILFVLLFLNFSFYAYRFFLEWQRSADEKARFQVQAERSEREKALMQYHHLRNQVNPHFLFNTLTSLDGLIVSDPELASQFVRHLSKVYRYVLEHSEREVVSLQTELDFIGHYMAVLKLKYNNALHFNIDVSTEAAEKGIAMVTLQMLIDNAVKHNMVHATSPLTISIHDADGFLCVKNNKQLRKQMVVSTKHGLQHLQNLYSYLSASPVAIEESKSYFLVKLPLL